jgi:hypothetical protein
VAGEEALAPESSQALKEESSLAFRLHHGKIEVDQLAVVCRISLSAAHDISSLDFEVSW